MIMFDAYNTPSLDPVTMPDTEGVRLIQSMMSDTRVFVRAFPCGQDNVTVFWTTTAEGRIGTVWEHTRHNAFNVPMTDGELNVESLRFVIEIAESPEDDEGYDPRDEYAVGE